MLVCPAKTRRNYWFVDLLRVVRLLSASSLSLQAVEQNPESSCERFTNIYCCTYSWPIYISPGPLTSWIHVHNIDKERLTLEQGVGRII